MVREEPGSTDAAEWPPSPASGRVCGARRADSHGHRFAEMVWRRGHARERRSRRGRPARRDPAVPVRARGPTGRARSGRTGPDGGRRAGCRRTPEPARRGWSRRPGHARRRSHLVCRRSIARRPSARLALPRVPRAGHAGVRSIRVAASSSKRRSSRPTSKAREPAARTGAQSRSCARGWSSRRRLSARSSTALQRSPRQSPIVPPGGDRRRPGSRTARGCDLRVPWPTPPNRAGSWRPR
jgi:hypothetical protein